MTESEINESKKNGYYNELDEGLRELREPELEQMESVLIGIRYSHGLHPDDQNLMKAWEEFLTDHPFLEA